MTTAPSTLIKCSDRLGSISVPQFQAALDQFGLGAFISAEPARGGLFGQNVLLTSSRGRYVLRGSPHNDWQFATERYFCRQLHERTQLPSPWPYLVESSPAIFGWPFAIMRRMPGDYPVDEFRTALPLAEQVGLARTMGETLARMGDATLPHFGRYDLAADAVVPFPGGLRAERRAWMAEMLESAMQFCPETIQPDRAWIDGIVAAAIHCGLDEFQPTVATSDFGYGNVLVERLEGGWRCSGIFDFMEYSSGDLELSLTRPLIGHGDREPALPQAFIQGYTMTRPLRPHARERLSLYVLGDRLCIWNYGHSLAKWFPPELGFRAFAEPQIASVLNSIDPYLR